MCTKQPKVSGGTIVGSFVTREVSDNLIHVMFAKDDDTLQLSAVRERLWEN